MPNPSATIGSVSDEEKVAKKVRVFTRSQLVAAHVESVCRQSGLFAYTESGAPKFQRHPTIDGQAAGMQAPAVITSWTPAHLFLTEQPNSLTGA